LRDDGHGVVVVVVAADIAEDPAVDISFVESIIFDESKFVSINLLCHLRIVDDSIDLSFVFFDILP